MEVALAKPPPCTSSFTSHEDSRRRGQDVSFIFPVVLGWSRQREGPRVPSEPWMAPQIERSHLREILSSLTPLFSLCRRRQPFLIHLRPKHYRQLLNPVTITLLPNPAFRPIYNKALLVGTVYQTQLVIRTRTGVSSVSVIDASSRIPLWLEINITFPTVTKACRKLARKCRVLIGSCSTSSQYTHQKKGE